MGKRVHAWMRATGLLAFLDFDLWFCSLGFDI
jgi:hypothetical protein